MRFRFALSLLLLAGVASADVVTASTVTIERERVLMGTRCVLVLQGEDPAALEGAATAAFETIARLEEVASNWRETSASIWTALSV